ncbi:hypothetical protein SCB49_03579 [unidentified eubacterium SCB49]|nr:hypothetical protein SCB49_03579 [unidentified eubacterium SCB49]
MKNLLSFGVIALMTLSIVSCDSSEKKKTAPAENKISNDTYTYSIDPSGASVSWTAYKFTDKVGVSGVFDSFELTVGGEKESLDDLLKESKLAVYTNSVNSNSDIRDPKLRASFFKVFNTDTITGNIKEAKNGKGLLDLKMNAIEKPLEYTYMYKRDTLFLKASINLDTWNGQDAIKALNEVCSDLHKGTDGLSKLWPDVDVRIKLPVKKTLATK